MKSASWIDNQNSRPVIGPIQVPFKRRTTRNSLMGRKYIFCVVNPPLSRSWSKPNTPQCWKYPSPNTPPLTGNTHVKLFPLSPLGSATLFNSSQFPPCQLHRLPCWGDLTSPDSDHWITERPETFQVLILLAITYTERGKIIGETYLR